MRRILPTGQWITSSDGARWFFDSGATALDFAYTGGFDDRLDADQHPQLSDWLHERFPEVDGSASPRDDLDAGALREAIAHLAVAASRDAEGAAEDVDVINLFAATPDIPPALAGGTRRAGRATARPGQALSAIARESVDLFAPASTVRIRECAADDCQLVFYDGSRSNNRRWCSMQRCGNRAKVRAWRSKT